MSSPAGRPVDEGVRIGVIGCGYWGPKHVRVACNLPSVSSVSVIDGRPERLSAIARSFPAVRLFPSSLRNKTVWSDFSFGRSPM